MNVVMVILLAPFTENKDQIVCECMYVYVYTPDTQLPNISSKWDEENI